jgi:hypothetical protein
VETSTRQRNGSMENDWWDNEGKWRLPLGKEIQLFHNRMQVLNECRRGVHRNWLKQFPDTHPKKIIERTSRNVSLYSSQEHVSCLLLELVKINSEGNTDCLTSTWKETRVLQVFKWRTRESKKSNPKWIEFPPLSSAQTIFFTICNKISLFGTFTWI